MAVKELLLDDGDVLLSYSTIPKSEECYFNFTLCGKGKIYECSVDYKWLEDTMGYVKMSKEEYEKEIQGAFINNETSQSYSFRLKKNMKLVWSKYLDKKGKDLKAILGEFSLSMVETNKHFISTFNEILLLLIANQKKLTTYHEEQMNSNENLKNATAKLDEFVDIKTNLERELFTKFVLVLNEKKSKINFLQQQVDKLKQQRMSASKNNCSSTDNEVVELPIDRNESIVSDGSFNLSFNEDVEAIAKLPFVKKKRKMIDVEYQSAAEECICLNDNEICKEKDSITADELLDQLK